MDLTRIILGPVVTEKAERMKESGKRVYTLHVRSDATKVDVKNALRKLYDVEVLSIRVLRMSSKLRTVGRAKVIRKRDPFKKMMVTLGPKSKQLDLTAMKS